MERRITKHQLGETYAEALDRAHRILTNFYESLFDRNGDPIINPGEVANMVTGLRQSMNIELDVVKSASLEYFESNFDAEKEGLL